MWMLLVKLACMKMLFLKKNYSRVKLLPSLVILTVILALGCLGTGVLYNEKDKHLIVKKNNAILSWKDTRIDSERKVDTILLKKGRDGQVRTTYFEVSMHSRLSILGEDFRLDYIKGRISLCGVNEIFILTNQYDRCVSNYLKTGFCNQKQIEIVVDDVQSGWITYVGHRDSMHIICIDATLSDGRNAYIPLGVSSRVEKESVLLRIEKREKCDYVIQENLYEFGVF
jgi:hypothetical protein